MNDVSLEFASLLCSRLCHDLMSPVGALANGLELLADESDPQMRQRCFELLEQSARISADKLRFFRLAFGTAGGPGETVPVAEVTALVDALAANAKRVTVDWLLGADALPRAAVKTLLNFALIGIEALVRGGTLDVGVEIDGGRCEIVVRAAGPRIAFDVDLGRALDGSLPESEWSSRTVHAAMVRELATGLGAGVQFALDSDALVLGADLPAG